jgi:hypothetical protein
MLTSSQPCGGWNPPSPCSGGNAISNPSCSLGGKFYPGPYDPNVCAAYATAQTAANKAAAQASGATSYIPVNFFNAYSVVKNSHALGTYCGLFSEVVDESFATYGGSWVGEDLWQVDSSWAYELSSQDPGTL